MATVLTRGYAVFSESSYVHVIIVIRHSNPRGCSQHTQRLHFQEQKRGKEAAPFPLQKTSSTPAAPAVLSTDTGPTPVCQTATEDHSDRMYDTCAPTFAVLLPLNA